MLGSGSDSRGLQNNASASLSSSALCAAALPSEYVCGPWLSAALIVSS